MAYVNLGQVVYPVGAIYASGSSISPATLFGGSWTQITNAALRGATSVGYTGSDECKLTTNQMPSHSHIFSQGKNGGHRESVVCGTASATYGGGAAGWSTAGSIFDAFIVPSGGGAAHTNVQRSYNCYIWQRKS